jgi:outer membrane protein, heavy metal efflux system
MPHAHSTAVLPPVVLVALLALAACGPSRSRAIVDTEVLRDLERIRLDAFAAPSSASLERAPASDELVVDTRDGVSEGEAVAIALAFNPELRAFREERGVAQGELVEAGLYPNVALQVRALTAQRPNSEVLDFTGVWAPPRPFEVGLREERAESRIGVVRAEICAREWQLATDTRKAFATLVAAEEQLRIATAGLELRRRIEKFVRDRRALGDASLVDVNQILIERVSTEREQIAAENERNRARLDRDLEQARTQVDLAYLARTPWVYFGPSVEREATEGSGFANRFGVAFGLVNLPFANVNQGQIAIAEAQRTLRGENFRALVHQGRAEVAEALRNVRGQRRLIRMFQDAIRPAIEENAKLTEAGFEMHEFNLVQLITTQELVLRNRREYVKAELEYRRAVFDLERAVGAPLETLR